MKKILCFLLIVLSLVGLSSCNDTTKPTDNNNDSSFEPMVITDLLGRTVEIKKEPKRVVCLGSGTLRLYSYIGDMSYICGVEDNERKPGPGKPLRAYKMVYGHLYEHLPSCGTGGNTQDADAEKILACKPDIVLSRIMDKNGMDNLSKAINKPVACISYGEATAFDPAIKDSIKMLGKIFNKKERADELVSYINGIEAELDNLTKDIKDSDKPSVYLGCYTNRGAHGFNASCAQFPLFDVSHIKNVLDVNGLTGLQMDLDLEKILEMNPDKVIIDAAGLGLFKAEYENELKAEVFNALKAFKNDEVYVELPYNGYYTNLEIAYCDAYFCASVAYPELFKDFDLEKKSREILEMFLHKDIYDDIVKELGLTFGKLDLAATFPNYKK